MPLPANIDDDRNALAGIVAGLFALLGLGNGAASQRIARGVHRAVGLVLRPAESAVRRLIVLISMTLKTTAVPVRPMPSGIVRSSATQTRPSFRLFDPRLRLVRKTKTPRATPRVSFFGDGEVRTIDLGHKPKTDGESDRLIASTRILRRLEALKFALDDLTCQARRLKRALQRRSKVPRLKLQGPLRPGYPPGHRRKSSHEIDDILRRCDWRARQALPPDTS